ncbi:MAG: hypothetical protein HYT80_08025 [Euryarchaeota archaeon]|nr:hypothetical protein [Euryarchaeota archaeon]
MLELQADGLPDTEIARRLGVSVSNVWRLRAHKLGLPRNPHRWYTFDETRARRLHAQSLVDRQISERLRVTREAIQKWRYTVGLPSNGWPKSGTRR